MKTEGWKKSVCHHGERTRCRYPKSALLITRPRARFPVPPVFLTSLPADLQGKVHLNVTAASAFPEEMPLLVMASLRFNDDNRVRLAICFPRIAR